MRRSRPLRLMLVFVGLATVVLLAPARAQAQAWFTKEACTVIDPAIDPGALDAAGLSALRAQAAKIPNATGRFWKITAPGGQVSHLWGTMHDSARLILDIPDDVRAVLAKARVFMPEFDPVAKSRAEVEAINRGDGFWVDGSIPVYITGLNPQVLEWISIRLESMGYGASSIDQLTWAGLAALMLDGPCNDFSGGIIPIQDSLLQVLAMQAGADVIGLEPSDIFMKEMNKPQRREIVKALVEGYGAYLGPHDVKASRRTAFHLYLTGQIGVMMAWDTGFFAEFFGETEGARIANLVNGYLVVERNTDFVASAKPELAKGGVVMAVGTFHLPGKTGLVSLLRQQGFTVERIPVPGEVD